MPDQTEYIELFNPTEQAISLEGYFCTMPPDEENNIRSIIPVSTRYKWLAPDSYVLIYSDDETTRFSESKLARYFELEGVSEEEVIHVDRTSLSLASTNDAIFLADSSGITIDSVYYDESWQNPNLYDTRGIAIEKIDPDGRSNSIVIGRHLRMFLVVHHWRKISFIKNLGRLPTEMEYHLVPIHFLPMMMASRIIFSLTIH